MDKIDQKILKELETNPTIPYSQLAKKIRVSKQVVHYRVTRLKEENIIKGFHTIINPRSLGGEHYVLFFRYANNTSYTDHQVSEYIQNQVGVLWAARTGGDYDLHVSMYITNYSDLDAFIANFAAKFSNLIREVHINYGVEHYYISRGWLQKLKVIFGYSSDEEKQLLDQTDINVLSHLANDARESSVAIGESVGLSYKTILYRIKKYRKNNVILGHRLIYYQQDDLFLILLEYQFYQKNQERKLINYLKEHNQVTQVKRLFGKHQLLFHIHADGARAVQRTLLELRSKYPIVSKHYIVPVFEDLCLKPNWFDAHFI